MTAKDKAFELVNKYKNAAFNCNDCDMPWCDVPCTQLNISESKECAFILVGEVIAELDSERVFERIYFWNEVKEEINKL